MPPYFQNLGKRITKSPKLYFYDTGLATTLIGMTPEQLLQQRTLYGALFENLIILDCLKLAACTSLKYQFSFFRDSNQREVDLIIEQGANLTPIEIKSAQTIHHKYFDTVNWFAEQTARTQNPIVIYGGMQNQTRTIGQIVPWNNLEQLFFK